MAVRRIALHTQAVSLPWAYLKYWTDGLTDVMSHLFPPRWYSERRILTTRMLRSCLEGVESTTCAGQ
jgi:hypothetical protein